MHWGLAAVSLCALGTCKAQSSSDLSPELSLLTRIKTTMSATLNAQPNYTCIQEIERSHRHGVRGRFQLHDMLRLEVALVDGKEMFAWPGARQFADDDLVDMVPAGGAIGTGNFATHARSVFQTSVPQFHYQGETALDGRPAYRFDYTVAQFASGYHLKVNRTEAVVGYHGSFWVDRTTLDLIRLVVEVEEIPPQIQIERASDVMNYGRVKIGSGQFLLPVSSELTMVDLNGNEDRNRTQFTACRQYTGESVLTFAEAPDREAPPPAPAAEKQLVELPVGASFDIMLETEIDFEHSMVGDPVKAILKDRIKQNGEILFDKGARLEGRIIRLERHGQHCDLDIRFTDLESDAARCHLRARVERTAQAASFVSSRNYSSQVLETTEHEGVHIQGDRFRMKKGYRLRVLTEAPPPADPTVRK